MNYIWLSENWNIRQTCRYTSLILYINSIRFQYLRLISMLELTRLKLMYNTWSFGIKINVHSDFDVFLFSNRKIESKYSYYQTIHTILILYFWNLTIFAITLFSFKLIELIRRGSHRWCNLCTCTLAKYQLLVQVKCSLVAESLLWLMSDFV